MYNKSKTHFDWNTAKSKRKPSFTGDSRLDLLKGGLLAYNDTASLSGNTPQRRKTEILSRQLWDFRPALTFYQLNIGWERVLNARVRRCRFLSKLNLSPWKNFHFKIRNNSLAELEKLIDYSKKESSSLDSSNHRFTSVQFFFANEWLRSN